MKVEMSYTIRETKVFEVPKRVEFYFIKDEDDYTDKEWDYLEEHSIEDEILMHNNIYADNIDEAEFESIIE